MLVPVLLSFQEKFPEVKLTIVTRAFFIPLFKGIKANFLIPDFTNKHKGLLGLYKLSKQIKTLEIDAVTDVHNVLRTKILKLLLFKIPFKQIDKGRKEKKALITNKIFKPLKTTQQRYIDVFADLNFNFDLNNNLELKPRILSENTKLLVRENELTTIGIAPFAAFKSKMYDIDLMKKVIGALVKNHKILLFGGGKNEVVVLDKIASEFPNTINVAGKISFEEELDLISILDVMLAMDSGNAHMAAMLGVKVITIWGVTHPYAGFYPYNQPDDYAITPNLKEFPLIPTSIYGNKSPESYLNVISTIQPETIINKIKKVL